MSDFRQFSEESIRKIQRDHSRLKALSESIAAQQQVERRESDVVRTVTGYTSTNAANPTYPNDGNTYVVRLRDYYFTETAGTQSKTQAGNGTRSIVARTWDGSSLVENTPVICDLVFCVGKGYRWWIRQVITGDIFRVKNTTGSTLSAGAVLELTTSVATPTRYAIVLNGIARAGVDPPCAVLLADAANNEIVDATTSGVCVANVDIIDADNTHARVVPGDTQLRGDFGGWARIIYKPSGTGVKSCVLHVGETRTVRRKARATTTVTDGGTGSADVYIQDSARGNVTVHYNWMTGAGNIANGSDLLIEYFHDEDKWVVVGAECPP